MEDPQTVSTFVDALRERDVQCTRTPAASFDASLAAVREDPAVGAPLPFDGLSLETSGIDTEPTPAQIEAARTGITAARLGVASYGTIVLQPGPDATEAASLFPELHVAVLRATDVVPDMSTTFQWLGERLRRRPQSAVLATGPSATADMGALVRGAHGPKRVHVLLLEDR